MNVLGIIAEYNPMHNGHIYQINEAKKKSHADFVVVVLSGTFTEQGNISIFSKFDKARLAIDCGVDMVIELPTIYAISSAENFAKGAIKILNKVLHVTHISFGAECSDINILKSIATKLNTYEADIINCTKLNLKSGEDVAYSRSLALEKYLTPEEQKEISKPNNILAIEYLKVLKKLNSSVIPVVIQRKGATHNSNMPADNYLSSTAIREKILGDKISLLKEYVPENVFSKLQLKDLCSNEDIWELLRYKVLTLGKSGISCIQDVSEGLENRLYETIFKCNSYEEYISLIKTKRYTLGRIKRILIYILLGITKEMYNRLSKVSYARVLAVSNKSKTLLSKSLITKITEKSMENLSVPVKTSISLDILATNIVCKNASELNMDYTNKIVI